MAKQAKKTEAKSKAAKSGKSEAQLAVVALEKAGWTRTQIAREVGTTFQSIRYYAMGGNTGGEKLAALTSLLGKNPPAEKADAAPKKATRSKPAKAEAPAKAATRSKPAVSKEEEEAEEAAALAAHKAAGKKGLVVDVPSKVVSGSLKAPSTGASASPKSVVAPFVDERQLTLPLDVLLNNGQLPEAMAAALRSVSAAGTRVQVQLVSVTVPFEGKKA